MGHRPTVRGVLMGLDITVLRGPFTYIGAAPDDDDATDEMYDRFTYVYNNPDFPDHMDGHYQGFYAGDAYHAFQASYGGYSHLRGAICEIALGVSIEHFWANLDEYEDCALASLFHFSDCEGGIGPMTSGVIAAGLNEVARKPGFAEEIQSRGWWMLDSFNDLCDAFYSAASTHGFVIYG